jgi:hypothetical protein
MGYLAGKCDGAMGPLLHAALLWFSVSVLGDEHVLGESGAHVTTSHMFHMMELLFELNETSSSWSPPSWR